MPKRRGMSEGEFRARWERLPGSDQRFLQTLIVVSEAIGDQKLRYHELPTRLERTLLKGDRDTLFSIIVECLGLLLDAPAMQRIKRSHRRRNGQLMTAPPGRANAVRRSHRRRTAGQSRRRR